MILVFPQATAVFNDLMQEMIKNKNANKFLSMAFGSYSFEHIEKVVLILLRNPVVESYLSDFLLGFNEIQNFEVLVLERETSGSICTILMASAILNGQRVAISALDQIVTGAKIDFSTFSEFRDCDVIAPTHRSEDTSLCYTLQDEFGKIIQLFEKKMVSDTALLGLYIISDFSDFLKNCHELIIKYRGFQNRVFYTSDVINNYLCHEAKCCFPTIDLSPLKIRSIQDMKKL